MLPKVNATMNVRCCTVYKVSNLQLRKVGTISEISMSKNMNTMKELRMEI